MDPTWTPDQEQAITGLLGWDHQLVPQATSASPVSADFIGSLQADLEANLDHAAHLNRGRRASSNANRKQPREFRGLPCAFLGFPKKFRGQDLQRRGKGGDGLE
jgi:hypothetical protein